MHAFLWLPGVRSTECHPFTIVSTNPVEMVIAAQDGFTKDLHTYAVNNSGKEIRAGLDGPYGYVPDFAAFTRVLCIAGGSGASYTFGAALGLARRLGMGARILVNFVWVVRGLGIVPYFAFMGFVFE